jgi:hypothetical protein
MNHAQDFDAVLVIHESCTWFWCCLSNTRIMHRLSQCWKRKLECKRIKFFLWLITGNQLLINNFSIAKHASSGLHCLPFFFLSMKFYQLDNHLIPITVYMILTSNYWSNFGLVWVMLAQLYNFFLFILHSGEKALLYCPADIDPYISRKLLSKHFVA